MSFHSSPLMRQALRSKNEGAEQLIMHAPICSQTVQMGQNSSLALGDTKVKCFYPTYKSKQWQSLGRNQENWQGSFPSLSEEVLASWNTPSVEVSKRPLKENFKHPEQLMDGWSKAAKVQVEMFSQRIPIFSTV